MVDGKRDATEFIDEPFEVHIRRGTAIFIWPSGLKVAFPLDVFRIQHERARKCLAEYDARQKAKVIPFKKG